MDSDHQERILNYTRITQLLARGEKHLHKIFQDRWLIFNKNKWTDGDGEELVKSCEAASTKVKELLANESIDLWDITATSHAIIAISKTIPTKAKEDKAIHALRDARNHIYHGKPEYSDDEFNQKWSHLVNILIKFGDSKKDIEELKERLMQMGKEKVEAVRVEKPLLGNSKLQYTKMKEEANKYFKANEYKKAVEIYNKILQLPEIIPEDKAVIFANRSVAHLSFNTEDSLKLAQRDAEWAIQLWPSWWRGYHRLARTQIKYHEWHEAENLLNTALALNPTSKEVRDDLSGVRSKIGFISREEHLIIQDDQPSFEEMVDQLSEQLKISKKRTRKYVTEFNSFPVIKGHNFIRQQDYENAAACFAKAANSGNIEGMFNFGKLLNDGKGVKRNYDEAMRWLLKAATSGDKLRKMLGSGVPEAQHLLGLKYYEGVGVDKDYKKAAHWYEKAFYNGFSGSANNLGIMYKRGEGVEKSLSKAFNYFKAASELGDTNAMMNLSYCYFYAEGTEFASSTDEDINEGMKWLKFAADKGNLAAASEFERRKEYSPEKFIVETFGRLLSHETSPNKNLLDKEQYKDDIKKAAKNGSSTAQRFLDIWKFRDIAIEAFKKNDYAKVTSALASAIRLDFQIVTIPEFLHTVIEGRMKTNYDEIDVVTCYVQMHLKKSVFEEIIDIFLPQFPNDKYLLEARISSYMVMDQINDALKFIQKALKLYPNSKRFLYMYAIALCMNDEKTNECISALDAFLAVVPKDHAKVPACHYRKAEYYFAVEDMTNFVESFEAGLAAEKYQLPCFMPYDFTEKQVLEKIYTVEKHKQLKKPVQQKNANPPTSVSCDRNFEKIKENLQRKRLLLQNRKIFIQQAELLATDFKPITHPPEKTPKPPSLVSLKKITFKEMDLSKDETYDGYVLEATIIDWAYMIHGIATIIEDENGDVQKFAIYNWPSKNVQVFDFIDAVITFRPNVNISIINPYLRIATDAQSMVRVEGPAFIKLDDILANKKCSCCGKESKVLPCSGCLMSRYCSKDCQKLDWIEFNHKEVCKHLKQFSQFMKT